MLNYSVAELRFIETLVVHKIKFLCHDFTKLRDFLNNPNVSVSILGKEE